jgi:Asp-tRNA(Asn)/Glu-tRNA(Gln) amidotransferase A subunit family amidase
MGGSYSTLSALDLVRRIDAGELTPASVVELCAQAIANHEDAVGTFAALDVERARQIADLDATGLAALRASRPASGRKGHF